MFIFSLSTEHINAVIYSILLITLTVVTYQGISRIQLTLKSIWLNPLLCSILLISIIVLTFNMPFQQYFASTKLLTYLTEPAVVALGYPLYQHLNTIKSQWKFISMILVLGVLIVIPISLILTMLLITLPEISVSLSLKSVTTPVGISLTDSLNGNTSITAFAIIIAGFLGAFLGPRWLAFINVKSNEAQGLAIGAASHALGTATISKISYEHSAYGSLALILSAVMTAIISPFLIPFLFYMMS